MQELEEALMRLQTAARNRHTIRTGVPSVQRGSNRCGHRTEYRSREPQHCMQETPHTDSAQVIYEAEFEGTEQGGVDSAVASAEVPAGHCGAHDGLAHC